MFEKILVPLDGSKLAEGILPYASLLAKGLDIPLQLLAVIDHDTLKETLESFPADERPSPSQVCQAAEAAAQKRLQEVAAGLADDGVQASSVVADGKPAEQIVRVADQEGCDLIAMSTHARSALVRGILGSVTDKVIHSSHLPTLTITPERAERYSQHGMTMSSIMVPLDGSPLAETALPYAEGLARKLSLEVVLVRAAHLASVRTPFSAGLLALESIDVDAIVEAQVVDYLKNIAGMLRAKGLNVRWTLLRGAPAWAIDELAQETPQDMIALATHGRSGLNRWMLGSVSEAVIRYSGDPVLVIPPTSTG